MKISNEFIWECVEEKFEVAVKCGVTRAYKHSDKEPPSDAQVDVICDSVRSALFEIFECPSPSGTS
jgi:hypothetical protein